MKNSLVIPLIILGAMACRSDAYKEIGPQYDLTTGVDGDWKISKVMIEDLTLPVPEGRDISDFFLNDPIRLQFDAGAGTYQVANPESLGNPFGKGGTFAFDDPEFPTAMTLYTIDQDTVNLILENMVREIDSRMGVKLVKNACDADYASYTYTFNRQ